MDRLCDPPKDAIEGIEACRNLSPLALHRAAGCHKPLCGAIGSAEQDEAGRRFGGIGHGSTAPDSALRRHVRA